MSVPLSTTTTFIEPAVDEGGGGWQFAELMVARWRVLIILPLIGGILAYAWAWTIKPTFTSTTSFVSDSPDRMGALGGFASVASQLGVGISSSPTSSPQFFADVLHSNLILGRVLRSKIPGSQGGDSIVVMTLYAPRDNRSERLWFDKAQTALRAKQSVSLNPRTGIIELKVGAPDPQSAKFVAGRFVEVLNDFNLRTRQTQAGQRRRFTGERLREAQDSLADVEALQQQFLQTNRSFRDAPALQARFERLQRQIAVYQELYTTLRRDYEMARINEVNDTPVITIVEQAEAPLRRSAPNRALLAIAGAMVFGFAALAWLLASSFLEQLRLTRPEQYARLVVVKQTFFRRNARPRTGSPERLDR